MPRELLDGVVHGSFVVVGGDVVRDVVGAEQPGPLERHLQTAAVVVSKG